ncbi:MAG: TonB-dependent receptor [Melioribacteraceae bacterium]|nr:TonB-dependent receptor [Melioribacteraceae bacterium]
MMRNSLLIRAGLLLGLLLITAGVFLTSEVHAQAGNQSEVSRTDVEEPARLEVLVFEGGRPVDGLTVSFADATGRTEAGSWRAEVAPARDRLTVFDNAQALTALPLTLRPGEIAQVIITLKGPERRAMVSVESSYGESQVELDSPAGVAAEDAEQGSGILAGRVVSTEDGEPIENARVFVSGTPIELRTDEEGRFEAEVPVGEYAVSVLAAEFATRTVDGVGITQDSTTERNFELPPAGLELAEYVVIEPFIEGSLSSVVAIRRESASVTDVLSAEQISRAGDSDAGGALKRVTGLTLVDGSFIFVRGLGERYSSVRLNGATLPSPDPTRRVLPMDLFPTDIISRIVVQKSSDSTMPGAFGGGAVNVTTIGFPEEFVFDLSYGAGYNTESTGQTGLTAAGGGDIDFTGYDDGTRDLPPLLADATADGEFLRQASIVNPDGLSSEQIEQIGEQVAARTVYDTQRKSLPVDRGFSLALGNSFAPTDWMRVGGIAAVQYSDEWRFRDELRRTFRASTDGLQLGNDTQVQRTLRNIDLSAFINAGVEFSDWTTFGINTMLLRQSEGEVRFTEGVQDSQFLRRFKLEWTENELMATQFIGSHRAPVLDTQVDWQFTTGNASREDPNRLEWRRDQNANGEFQFSRRADSNSQSWFDLEDDLTDWSIEAEQPIEFGPVTLIGRGGLSSTERDRIAEERTFSFDGLVSGDELLDDQESIFNPDNIAPRGLRLSEITRATDNYTAEQQLDAWNAQLEVDLFERVNLVGGIRHEDNFQRVETDNVSNPLAPPVIAELDGADDLLSGSLTLRPVQDVQFRFAYSQTLARPDFREISPAPFIDPVLDLSTVGNPDLQITELENLDARIEYFFDEIDGISFSYFYKDLTNPIETVVTSGGSGLTVTIQNALAAEIEGWEAEFYRKLGFVNSWSWLDRVSMGWVRNIGLENFYVSANYSDITTSISIDPENSNATNTNRVLQGASPWTVNAQIGYTSPGETLEFTALYNNFGERIIQAGTQGQPDIFEEPFASLDFVARYRFRDNWTLKLELENLLDSSVEWSQGNKINRSFKPGMNIKVGLQFRM